jgi:hypothetical protein
VVQALVQFDGVTYVVIWTALEVVGVVTGTNEDGTDDTDTDEDDTDDPGTDKAETDDAGTDEVSAVDAVALEDAG